jgi:hypothetical protein
MGGRDQSERVVAIVGMRRPETVALAKKLARYPVHKRGRCFEKSLSV